jgi:hypothetical protein
MSSPRAASSRSPLLAALVPMVWRYGLTAALALTVLLLLAYAAPRGGGGGGGGGETAATTLRLAPSALLAPGVAGMCAGRTAANTRPIFATPGSEASAGAAAAAPPPPPPGGAGTPDTVFSRIYSTLRWSADGGGSGTGSTVSATATLRAYLEMLVYRHQVTRVLDAPCGSSHWWPELLARLRAVVPCFTYAGVDVVGSVVEASRAAHAGDALTSFQVADLSVAGVGAGLRAAAAAASGGGGFDLALCRDALQHLPLALAVSVLENLGATGARLVALGSYLEETAGNAEIPTGEYYKINLLLPPFSLNASRAVDVLNENSRSKTERKYVLLFTGEYIAGLDFGAMRERVREFKARRGSGGGARGASSSAEGLLAGS